MTGTGEHEAFFEVRLESIGGLGAHLAGQILAEAAVLGQGLSGAHFSSYGSEKKGSPVKSYVRLCAPDQPVRTTAPVRHPHVVAVFHAALLQTEDVTAGLRPGGAVVVNTTETAARLAAHLAVSDATVIALDALGIAVAEQTRVNTAMLGALARAIPGVASAAIRAAIARTLGSRYPHLAEANLRTFDRGYREASVHTAPAEQRGRPQPPRQRGYGYATAPTGGVLTEPGNTVLKDLSASRQGFLPEFVRERCVDCAVCDLVCPDLCFVWQPTGKRIQNYPVMRLAGIDYQYCKGCMRCVAECPTEALISRREEPGWAKAHGVSILPLLRGASEPAAIREGVR